MMGRGETGVVNEISKIVELGKATIVTELLRISDDQFLTILRNVGS